MPRKIIYLINPISGTGGHSSLKDIIATENNRRGIEFDIHYTNANGNYHFLPSMINKENITDVVVCGGDGSVNAVASALIGVEVNLGIIPMGSGNGLAFTAKIPRQTLRALDTVFNGTASYIDGFYINGQFSCMLCGIGFDAKVAHDFAKEKKGVRTYIKVILSNFFSAKPYTFEISPPDKSFLAEAFFISIANSNQFGNNFTIAPKADLQDGLLDIIVVKKMSKMVLLFSILGQVTGFNLKQDLNHDLKKRILFIFKHPRSQLLIKMALPYT